MRQIVLDTETTGLSVPDGHRIIEIGCVELVNRRLTGKRFHQYINPEREIDAEAMAVHGITNEFLLDKPTFVAVAAEFMDFISGSELIIHNAPFDVGFINKELSLIKKWQALTHYCHVIDSLVIAKQLHVGQRNSLDALCKRYGIDNSQRDLHGALMDANLLAQVYLAMTGGQSSLFDENPAEDIANQQAIDYVAPIVTKRNLHVQLATADELAAHQEQLQKILKKGKCLWLT